MQMPTIKTHCWELRSGEESHKKYPDTFWIPPLEQRVNLKVGQAAKLVFEIECEDENGIFINSERMWVIVSEIIGDFYIGILDNKPASFMPSDEVYLCFGAEIPFKVEHIIDIAEPPEKHVKWQLSLPPERRWLRG